MRHPDDIDQLIEQHVTMKAIGWILDVMPNKMTKEDRLVRIFCHAIDDLSKHAYQRVLDHLKRVAGVGILSGELRVARSDKGTLIQLIALEPRRAA